MARLSARVEGLSEAIALLKNARPRFRRKTLRKAFGRGGTVVAKVLRPLIPHRQGLLKKSIIRKVATRSDGEVQCKIGARNQKTDGANPAKYFHLVEGGTTPHKITPHGKLLAFTGKSIRTRAADGRFQSNGKNHFARHVNHPGARAQRVLQRARSMSQFTAVNVIRHYIQLNIAKDIKGR